MDSFPHWIENRVSECVCVYVCVYVWEKGETDRERRRERVCVSVFVTDRERFYARHKLRVFDLKWEIQQS